MNPDDFEALVDQAVAGLPDEFAERMENVSIVVEDYPSESVLDGLRPRPSKENLLGVYIGVPVPLKHPSAIGVMMPDRIEIYQKNIEAYFHTDAEIIEQIRETIIHEVGHYFGLDEPTLRRLQRRRRSR